MALDKITHLSGRGVYIPGDDIDTDRIIPARFMKCVTFDGLGDYLFHDARFFEDGSEKKHPLNDPRFTEATIIVSDSNFGCGSSREHAPQAIYRYGVRAVIAESFAEIFFGNSTTLGMPCIEATPEQIELIAGTLEQKPDTEIAIDLENERITFADKTLEVTVRATAKDALVRGQWDPIAELLEADRKITETAQRLPYLAS